MKQLEKTSLLSYSIFFSTSIFFLTDDSQLFFFKLHSIYFFIRSYKESSSELHITLNYIKRKNKKCILNEKS
jgi:hypothetical protein